MLQGKSFSDIIQSLSAQGSTSADLANITITGDSVDTRPLTNYNLFSNHVYFGDAVRKFRNALNKIETSYPIGLSGSFYSSLCAENIYAVDKWRREASGYENWLLEKLSISGTITASAINHKGETIPLIHIVRDSYCNITGTQSDLVTSLSAETHLFEEENIELEEQTSGSLFDPNSSSSDLLSLTAEKYITRNAKLKTLLPQILFYGDNDENLEKLLSSFGDTLDEIKEYADQISNTNFISYENIDRVPNRFLPVLAQHFGIELYQSAINNAIDSYFTASTSGYTGQQITYSLWNRILNNIVYLLKRKGTKESLEAIVRLYGSNSKYIKVQEYSIFNKPTQIRDDILVDVPVFYAPTGVHIVFPASAHTAFDFAANSNFTLEARASVSSAISTASNKIVIDHPKYKLSINASGQTVFAIDSIATIISTPQCSISSFIGNIDNFVNIAVNRSGNVINVYSMVLSGSGTGFEDIVYSSSTSVSSASNNLALDSEVLDKTYIPSDSNFNDYLHEVRVWDGYLAEDDLKEHTRNFESTSFINSTANNVSWTSLRAHYKLRENVVLQGNYNFIVDSTTGGYTGIPVNFSSVKRYKTFVDQSKINKWSPVGLDVDNDKITQIDPDEGIEDTSYISIILDPINTIDRDIKNAQANLSVADILCDPIDLYKPYYQGTFSNLFSNILSRYNGENIVDLNSFIKASDNFNDSFGSIFKFIKQFVPAKNHVLAEGILIRNPILERPRLQKRVNKTESSSPSGTDIYTHYFIGSNTAASTATFQGYKYGSENNEAISNTLSSNVLNSTILCSRSSIRNVPRYYISRNTSVESIEATPFEPNLTEIDVTLNNLIIQTSDTASTFPHLNSIVSEISLIKNGKSFKTNIPAIRFEFPVSSNGDNYFYAEIGNIDQGKGRIVEGKDSIFISNLENGKIQMKLQASNTIKSLSTDTNSLSGTVGIVPIKITNLFSKAAQIIRVGIGNDVTSMTENLKNQGGVKIRTY